MSQRVPIWKRRRFKFPNIAGFIRRHDKWFTTLGALIVFLTFITREGLREMARDSANSLKAGQSEYYLEKQIAAMTFQLAQVRAWTDVTGRRTLGVTVQELKEASYKQRLNMDSARIETLVMRLQSMIMGIQDLDDSERIPGATKIGEIITQVQTQARLLPMAASTNWEASSDLVAIEKKSLELEQETDDLGTNLVSKEQAQSFRDSDARDYFDEISYVLYIVGWTLALVARLVGDREPSSETWTGA
jgi:hypothetical protein